jgi:hypothetical protein
MSVHAAIALGLDFSWGSSFQKKVKNQCGSTVHPLGKSSHFLLAVSFGHAKFKLDCDSVSIALESCIGGLYDDLDVCQLGDRIFHFSVNSKVVGFMVYALRSFVCEAFKCYFHLWGNGGPAWKKEFSLWQMECQEEWIMVSPNKKRTDRAIRALKHKPHRSVLKKNHLSNAPKKKLCFASFMSYPACSGYEYPATPEEDSDIIQAGYSCPQVKRRSGNLILPASLQISDVSVQFGTVSSPVWAANQNSIVGPNPELPGQDPNSSRGKLFPLHNEANFSRLIDDLADQFWHCDRCLSLSHDTISCTGKIRCKGCFRYGHIKSDYWRVKKSFQWVVKTSFQPDNLDSCAGHKDLLGDCDTSQRSKNSSSSTSQPPSPPMANYPVDPHRFISHGFDILEPWGAQDRPARMYLTTTVAPPKRHES